MKRICQRCNVISQDFNLWCQEKYCPAENATEIFDNGEWFGPIEIVQPIVITRSAIVYHAQRGEEKILLKIANADCEDKLRKEARAFLELAKSGQNHFLPVLLPAYPQAPVEKYPYGRTVINERVKYYEVFAFAEGAVLRNLLLKNPQPWYPYAGWIVSDVADAVSDLHRIGKYHLCINPDIVLVRYDKKGYPRTMLIDLGISDSGSGIHAAWNENYNLPAYTAPEIVSGYDAVGSATDIYGLGMLLYEMLEGHPAYEYHLKKDEAVTKQVMLGNFKSTSRTDLKDIPDIAEKAISLQYNRRFANVTEFANALKSNLSIRPVESKSIINWRKINWRMILIVSALLILVVMLVVIIFINSPV